MSIRRALWVSAGVAALLLAGTGVKLALRARTNVPKPAASSEPANDVPRVAQPLDVAESVYGGKLGNGWSDWGWGPHELGQGAARVVFGNYGGITFRHAALDPSFGALSFRYRAPADWPQFLTVSLRTATTGGGALPNVIVQPRHVATLADGWHEVLIDMSELDPEGLSFDRIVVAAGSKVDSNWVLIDDVVLTKPATTRAQSAPGRKVQLEILCRRPAKPINPLIYGSAQGDWSSGQSAQRLGGNPTSRFNWPLGVSNSANDWFYENHQGPDLYAFLDSGLEHGADNALTVPIIGWVAKDASSVGFPRKRFANQRKFDPYRSDAGDGHYPDGKMIAPGPPDQTSVPAPPELIGSWIRSLRERDRSRGKRGVQMYILDNEPSLWDVTHHDIHPAAVGYDELLDRTLRYATEIRKADADAVIAGPAEWGFAGYMYSGRDRAAGSRTRADRRAHGDIPLIPWYLKKIAEHEQQADVRLLDVLDVHFYPAGEGLYGANARTDAEGAALRLRSTRALWDATYTDESWINEPIRLIPMLKEWVSAYHPGLKVSLGEWSFGADEHISGGLATAEALGRFGQQGLDAAFYWDGPKAGTATFWAFRAFRNFDEHGARFQDLSLATREADPVSLFASRDATSSKLVAVLLNRDPNFVAFATVGTDGCGKVRSQRVFRFVSGSNGLLAEQPFKLDGTQLSANLPPSSLTVLDVETEPNR